MIALIIIIPFAVVMLLGYLLERSRKRKLKRERVTRKKRRIAASSFYSRFKDCPEFFEEGPGWHYSFAFDRETLHILYNDWVTGESLCVDAGDIYGVEIIKNGTEVWSNGDSPASGPEIVRAFDDEYDLFFSFPELTEAIDVRILYISRSPEGNERRYITIPCYRYFRDAKEYIDSRRRKKAISILEKAVAVAAKIVLIVDWFILFEDESDIFGEAETRPDISLEICEN